MENQNQPSPVREAAIATLAVVGFVALMGGSVWLAYYSTRYVPTVVNRFGAAAVYLGSFFQPAPPAVSVVPTPTATTTLPFERPATTTPVIATPVKPVTPQPVRPIPTTPGTPSSGTYPINGSSVPAPFYGYPDFTVTITATGYLTSTSTDSFVAGTSVPYGSRPAVRFTIKNGGTNIAAPWRFSASIPTQSSYIFESPIQQQLNPGESIDYTLGFDQANKGAGQMISVTANFDRAVTESNPNNNSASAALTIIGS